MRNRSNYHRVTKAFVLICFVLLVKLFLWDFAYFDRPVRLSLDSPIARPGYQKSISLFIAPKAGFGSQLPAQLIAWKLELESIDGEVVLLLNQQDDIFHARRLGFKCERVRESHTGLPLLDSMLEVMSLYHNSMMVGFCNSDLFPGNDVALTISQLSLIDLNTNPLLTINSDLKRRSSSQRRKGWLLVASRIDFSRIPSDGQIFMDGGVDVWIWNNVKGLNDIFGAASAIPAFRIGRPWFDNWLTATAMQLGGRHVIDGTKHFHVLHKVHKRMGSLPDWNDFELLSQDADWSSNKMHAQKSICFEGTCSRYVLGIGTSCEAPLVLALGGEHSKRLKVLPREVHLIQPCPKCPNCYD